MSDSTVSSLHLVVDKCETTPLLGNRRPRELSLLEALTLESSKAALVFKLSRWIGGCLLTCVTLPFAMFGCGPVVVCPQGHQAAVLKFGSFSHVVGPGTYHVNIGMEQYIVKSIQVQMLAVPSQQVLTKDNISITLDAVVFFRIVDICKALFEVTNIEGSIISLAMSSIYTLLGEMTLDELFATRTSTNNRIRELVSEYTNGWGIEVRGIEIRDIHVPQSMQRVMAAVAEATREGDAKVVSAKADLRAAETFAAAANVIGKNPIALQLRYFQTLTEIASEKSSTIIVPSEVTSMFKGLRSWHEAEAFAGATERETEAGT